MARLVLLGTASAYPRRGDDSTFFALEDDRGGFLLVDSGGSPLPALMAAGLDPSAVTGVFLTHNHADHMAGFPLLIHGLEMLDHAGAIRVAGSRTSLAAARALLRALGVGETEKFPLLWEELPPDARSGFRVGAFELAAFPVSHSRPALGLVVVGAEGAAGGRADAGGTGGSGAHDGGAGGAGLGSGGTHSRLVFSGDTGPSVDLVREARGAGVLVHECGLFEEEDYPYHTTPEQLAEIAEKAEPDLLVIVHTPPARWADRERVLSVIRRRHRGRVEFGEPFRSYPF